MNTLPGNKNQMEGMPSSRIRISHNMTLRQYYAGLAMQGLSVGLNPSMINDCAKWSVQAADALIEALNKPTDGK